MDGRCRFESCLGFQVSQWQMGNAYGTDRNQFGSNPTSGRLECKRRRAWFNPGSNPGCEYIQIEYGS